MRTLAFGVTLSLWLASFGTAQTVTLHGVYVYPDGTVVVRYTKDFATCAHLKLLNGTLVHAQNFFCATGNEILVTQPLTSFTAGFGVGTQVRLCHGNLGSICSAPFSVTAAALDGTPSSLVSSVGGTQGFTLDAGPAFAGLPYLLAGSVSGAVPGFPVGGLIVPLNPDFYFSLTIDFPNTAPLANSLGLLDASGRSSATLTLPPGLPPLVAEHAFAVVNAAQVVFVSNPERLTITP